MKKIFFTFYLCLIFIFSLSSQEVYPTHWWVGMKNPSLSLLLRGDGIGHVKTITTSYPGITVKKIIAFESKGY